MKKLALFIVLLAAQFSAAEADHSPTNERRVGIVSLLEPTLQVHRSSYSGDRVISQQFDNGEALSRDIELQIAKQLKTGYCSVPVDARELKQRRFLGIDKFLNLHNEKIERLVRKHQLEVLVFVYPEKKSSGQESDSKDFVGSVLFALTSHSYMSGVEINSKHSQVSLNANIALFDVRAMRMKRHQSPSRIASHQLKVSLPGVRLPHGRLSSREQQRVYEILTKDLGAEISRVMKGNEKPEAMTIHTGRSGTNPVKVCS